MPQKSPSVIKRARQNDTGRLRNRRRRQELKTALKAFRAAPGEQKRALLPKTQSVVDKSARKHIVHRNAARRLKSRLAREAAEQG